MSDTKSDPRKSTYTPGTALEHVMGIMAYHLRLVSTEEAPAVIRCGLHGPTTEMMVRVIIEPRRMPGEDPVWDQCYIALAGDPENSKGDWVGNRAGAATVLAQLYADVIADVARATEPMEAWGSHSAGRVAA